MWQVTYHRRRLVDWAPETFRYTSKYWFKAFIVYLWWRTGYVVNEHEIRYIHFYRTAKNNVIYLDTYKKKRGSG